jgi:LPXTG-motif cell wall-anchored protein
MGRIAAERVTGTCLLLIMLSAAVALPQHEAVARQPTKGIVYVRNAEMYLASNQGSPLRLWSEPLPPLAMAEREQGMPNAGQAQANDWITWTALIASLAIVVGFLLIYLRRRKGGDGL